MLEDVVESPVTPSLPLFVEYTVLALGAVLACTALLSLPRGRGWVLVGRAVDVYVFLAAAIVIYTLEPIRGDFVLSRFYTDPYALGGIGLLNASAVYSLLRSGSAASALIVSLFLAATCLACAVLLFAGQSLASAIVFYALIAGLAALRVWLFRRHLLRLRKSG